ncbi:MAG: DVU0298 family protein [Thermodesulfobacteriota bacterium]
MNTRQLKKEIFELLSAPDLQERLVSFGAFPPRKAVNPLFSFLYHIEPMIRWHAVSAMGYVVAGLADKDLESARVIMRRMIWNLNDESGGIGWGSPEAMGESMACHHRIAGEYHRILISYIRPDGNFLEHPELQKGLLWGLARLATVQPELVEDAGPFLIPFLESKDAEHRGLAALAAGSIQEKSALNALENLLTDCVEITLYWDQDLKRMSVEKLAKNALKTINTVEK